MSNSNNENNPPESCTKEIHLKPNTEGHTETVNTAGVTHGGVGNTNINVVQAQGDKERLRNKMRALLQNLKQYGDAVQDEKKKMIKNIEVEQAKQRRQFEDERREREELQRQMQRIEDEQARQKRQCEDLRRENTDLRKEIKEFQSQIQNLLEVIEEKDNDIRQLKDLRTAAAESKVQGPQDAVQEKTIQDKHGREEGKTASSEVTGRGTTATGTRADGSVASQGETQKDSNSHHDAALLHACRVGNMAEVKLALDLGQVNVNCRGWCSRTPVMWTAGRGHRDVVELLLSRGADVSLVDMYGNNTFHLACSGGDVGTVELMLSLDEVDVNCRGERSRTPVMWTAGRGHRDVVELLLSRGADVSLVDMYGNNTLHWACGGGDVGTVELILSRDVVDINARNNRWQTAADVARGRGHHQLVDLIVSHDAL